MSQSLFVFGDEAKPGHFFLGFW